MEIHFNQDNSGGSAATFNPIRFEDASSQSGDDISIYSFDAPSFSPITTDNSCCSLSSATSPVDEDNLLRENEPVLDEGLDVNEPVLDEGLDVNLGVEGEGDLHDLSCRPNHWTGFKLIIDNLDKNFHLSFQRCDKQTESMHICHVFAVKDRIDFSSYNDDDPIAARIDVNKLMINKDDLKQVKSDAKILFSRYVYGYIQLYNTLLMVCFLSFFCLLITEFWLNIWRSI